MKANEAPDRLYIPNPDKREGWFTKTSDRQVEYTRTDAFIEKVSAWIKKMFSETDWRFNQDYTGMLIEDFKNYMKGE